MTTRRSVGAAVSRHPAAALSALGAAAMLVLLGLATADSRAALVGFPKVGEVFRDCDTCPEMVVLPGGTFAMGSETGTDQEKPVHLVSIAGPFAMSRYEVTWEEWLACGAAGICTREPDDHLWGRERRPIINISWAEATQYAGWLSELTGARYRLASEAEWEFAARGGTYTAYPWGDDIGTEMVNCRECNTALWDHQSLPVGLYPPNPFGLYDMQGNVWEWVQDCWNDSYVGAPEDGSARNTGDCARRVTRSGSWYYFPLLSRSASRDSFPADLFSYNIGIRLVRELL